MVDREFTNYDALPLVLKISHITRLFQISESKLRRELQDGTFQPEPFARNPYRWKKRDVIDYLETPTPHARALHVVSAAGPLVLRPHETIRPLDQHRRK